MSTSPLARPLLAALAVITLAGCAGDDSPLCDASPTPIAGVQGASTASPMLDQTVTVRGVITQQLRGDGDRASGYFLQAVEPDDDAATSDGLFVEAPEALPVGSLAAVRGRVAELGAEGRSGTALIDVEQARCGRADLPSPLPVTLPFADPEAIEAMRVAITSDLTVVGVYDLGRRGRMRVASGGLTYQPTEVVKPGPAAQAIAETNRQRMLLVDDADEREYPGLIAYLPAAVTLKRLPRTGDQISGLVGVLDRRGYDRLHTTSPFVQESQVREPRFSPPAGEFAVASLNLLNYFNGDGLGGGFPTSRGADDARELERQQAKLVATVHGLGLPDVIALQELENDGFGPQSAIHQLTDAINARIRSSRTGYSYVALDEAGLGTDQITVGLLYRRDKIVPIGAAATLVHPAFEKLSRPPLAQTFETIATGKRFSVAAVHLKSKGCRDAAGPDLAQGDGQGCYNAARVMAVEALLEWLATDPTGSGDPDWLLIGDFNAYSREDPLRKLEAAGYENLVARHRPGTAYSFVYQGQAGSLDHAFASPSFARQAGGARIWHINAAFPAWMDYNLEGKPAELDKALYKASAVRASDHDPLTVSFR